MVTDPIADALTRIRNAQMVRHKTVRLRNSKMALRLLDVLKAEGFIDSVEVKKDADDKFEEIEVSLKYFSNGAPMMSQLTRRSKPGRRVYKRSGDLPRVDSGLGLAILSTSQGVMSDREARKRKIGGEVLAFIS